MSNQSVDGGSLQVADVRAVASPTVSSLSPKPTFYELLTTEELAERWRLPVSWIRSRTRRRTLDEIPCVRFGRWVRFAWGSPELTRWLAAHQEGR